MCRGGEWCPGAIMVYERRESSAFIGLLTPLGLPRLVRRTKLCSATMPTCPTIPTMTFNLYTIMVRNICLVSRLCLARIARIADTSSATREACLHYKQQTPQLSLYLFSGDKISFYKIPRHNFVEYINKLLSEYHSKIDQKNPSPQPRNPF